MIRTYSELSQLETYEERFEYLKLKGQIAEETFGHMRYLNQILYQSPEWQDAREEVITRDYGCDLGIDGRDIFGSITVHHMNPITPEDILNGNPDICNPEFLVSVSDKTHKAIHYGCPPAEELLPIVRTKNDTIPWKN